MSCRKFFLRFHFTYSLITSNSSNLFNLYKFESIIILSTEGIDFPSFSISEQHKIIDSNVNELELQKIRELINKIIKNNPEILNLSKPKLEVFLYELVDKVFYHQKLYDAHEICQPYLSNRLLETEISHFKKYLSEKNIPITHAAEEHIREYLQFYLKNNKSISQVRISLSQIRKYYDILIKNNPDLFYNPAKNIKIDKQIYENVKKITIPTDNEIELITNHLPPFYAALVVLMCIKGYSHQHIKTIQCLELQNNKYDLDIVYDDDKKSHYHFADLMPHEFFNTEYYPHWYKKIALIYQQNISEISNFKYVPRNFENFLQKVISSLYEQKLLKEAYTAKSFRHYCINRIYEKTHDETLICKILEHSNLTTTRVYLRDLGLMEQKQH